ncbi:MAG: acylphosphatase, partial [Candidatus Bathyarchaeia archaeon]
MTRLKATLSGIVQGVGFRPFVYRVAIRNNLSGYVRNRGDSCLEILVEGQEDDIKNFLRELVEKKPPLSRIYEIVTTPLQGEREHKGFTIYKSSEKTEFSGSIIPPDISICDECLGELRDSQNPRYDFFFITCTNCGPRFTIIEDVPYDRENTTMREFPMCDFC